MERVSTRPAWSMHETPIQKQANSQNIGESFVFKKRFKKFKRMFLWCVYVKLIFLSCFFFLSKSELCFQIPTGKTLDTGEIWNLNFASKIITPSQEQSRHRHSHNPHLDLPRGFKRWICPKGPFSCHRLLSGILSIFLALVLCQKKG